MTLKSIERGTRTSISLNLKVADAYRARQSWGNLELWWQSIPREDRFHYGYESHFDPWDATTKEHYSNFSVMEQSERSSLESSSGGVIIDMLIYLTQLRIFFSPALGFRTGPHIRVSPGQLSRATTRHEGQPYKRGALVEAGPLARWFMFERLCLAYPMFEMF